LTDSIVIFFEGLLFLLLFHIVGHPVANIFLRRREIPQKLAGLDFVQRLPLEFVLGGAIVYLVTLIMTPFGGFNVISCGIVVSVSTFAYVYQHLKGLAEFKRPSPLSCVALAVFVVTLMIRVGPISNFVLGSNQDLSWHTLLTYSVIENGGIPFSVIENFVLQVPVGVHTNLAYFSLLTGIPAEFTTFYSLTFFSTIMGLAAYLFGSILHSQKFGLYIALVMVTITYYPSAFTWGSPWLVLGLLIFFVATSLIISFDTEDLKTKKFGILIFLLPGLVTGFLASTFIPLYVLLVPLSFFLILLNRKDIFGRLKGLFITFILSVPLFAVWIYRYFFLIQPTTDWITQQAGTMMYNQALEKSALFLPIRELSSPNVIINTVGNWLAWDYRNGWPGSIFSFVLLVFGGVLLLHFFLNYRTKGLRSLVPSYVVSIILILILWGLIGPEPYGFYVTSFGLGLMVSELDKVTAIMGTILLPIIAAYAIIKFDRFVSIVGARFLSFVSDGRKVGTIISFSIILLVLSVSIIIAPSAQAWQVGSYKIFATSTESDYELLKWMHSEIPSNSNVLVNTEDAGQYVPSIGGQHAIYFGSTGVKALTQGYHILFNQIKDKVFNSTTIELLRNMKVDYVFLGAGPILVGGWDPVYFLRNPWYFRLVHSVGRSGLFEVNLPYRNASDSYINSRDYLGFSSNETSLDLKNMRLINLVKNEDVFVEIGLNDEFGRPLEVINYEWNADGIPLHIVESSAINLTSTSNFTLIGLNNYSFRLTTSLTETNGIHISISAENAPPQSTVYFSMLGIDYVRQGDVHFATAQKTSALLSSNLPVQGTKKDSEVIFEIIPNKQQVVTSYLHYVTTRSIGELNIVVQTKA
jgi:hypothetical protein